MILMNRFVATVAIASILLGSSAQAQVRTKKPDREVYRPPQLASTQSEKGAETAVRPVPIRTLPLRDPGDPASLGNPQPSSGLDPVDSPPRLVRPASHVVHQDTPISSGDIFQEVGYHGYETYSSCDSCGGGGCDSCMGCDSMACGPAWHHSNWFGELELLLMFRKGDVIPPLVTTDPASEGVNAGTLPNATVLAGNEKIFDEMTAGGRVTVGLWLDHCQNRSLVARLWSATETDYGFSANQVTHPVLAIPFFNVNENAEATNLIVFPTGTENRGRFGSVNVSGASNLYGGDLSIRQFWTGGLGTTFDVLYGYQYMRLDESLRIDSNSTLTQTVSGTAQAGFTSAITDEFNTTNEFHGGQFGLAGRFRENCWSFNFLAKVGFGQMRRESELFGETRTSNGSPPVATQNDGLFVRSSNEGTFTSRTFGWTPELNVDLGWHYFPRFDVTIGYHLIAMSDVVKLSSLIDRSTNDDDGIRPQFDPDYDDYFVHGITFGIRSVF